MSDWKYDVATQSIAGGIAGIVVGVVLLVSQFRFERRMERERRRVESAYELLGAALKMHQLVGWAFAGTGSQERVATGWTQAHQARAEWLAVEAVRDFPKEVMKASQDARDALERDLLAIMAMSPAGGGGEASTEDRERWLSIGKRQPFALLEPLITACKRTAS
jgi:hypothetical protein